MDKNENTTDRSKHQNHLIDRAFKCIGEEVGGFGDGSEVVKYKKEDFVFMGVLKTSEDAKTYYKQSNTPRGNTKFGPSISDKGWIAYCWRDRVEVFEFLDYEEHCKPLLPQLP